MIISSYPGSITLTTTWALEWVSQHLHPRPVSYYPYNAWTRDTSMEAVHWCAGTFIAMILFQCAACSQKCCHTQRVWYAAPVLWDTNSVPYPMITKAIHLPRSAPEPEVRRSQRRLSIGSSSGSPSSLSEHGRARHPILFVLDFLEPSDSTQEALDDY